MRIGIFRYLLILFVAGAAFLSCKRSTLQIEKAQESDYIARYVQRYMSDIKPTDLGLYYQPIQLGDVTADSIRTGDVVKVYYSGFLIQDTVGIGIKTGNMFSSSGDYEPFSFTVGGGVVVQGWEELIRLMKDGGEANWLIPSKLGYAAQPQAGIPAYSPLVFHIKIYKVYRSTDVFPILQQKPPGSSVEVIPGIK